MTKKEISAQIDLITDNLDEGNDRYRRGELTLQQWDDCQRDARQRRGKLLTELSELKRISKTVRSS